MLSFSEYTNRCLCVRERFRPTATGKTCTIKGTISDCNFIKGAIGDCNFIKGAISDCNFIKGAISDCNFMKGAISDCNFIKGAISDCNFINGTISDHNWQTSLFPQNPFALHFLSVPPLISGL